jgi:predicted Ser/Thr protein kinase
MSDAVIGKEVDGYRIQAVLGRGGMGTVYKAEDVNLSRTVAIKRINPGQQEREAFIHRFRSEAQALARIDSPNIVGVYALRETDIGLLIVMEYVEGGTLKDPIENQGAMAPAQALPILEQTMQAFHDAHSAGVIHRDIKPENVMLTTDGMVKVTDFGIAKLRQPDSGETVTQGGQGGTLKYMSPEQISNISEVDARSDLYSLGMTAYEILAGDLPFEETDTDFDIMRKVVEGKIPPPDELNPDIPSGVAQWIVGAIQKQQDERYQSAEEMLEALREADRQTGEKTVTQPDWEVDDGSADVDETRTIAPDDADQTQTVAPGGDDVDRTQTVVPGGDAEEEPVEAGGETVMDPGGATQPAVPDPDTEADPAAGAASDEEAAEDGPNWIAVGGGIVAALVVIAGGVLAYSQLGGGGAATATLSLNTAPAGATVLVNGDTAGTTPLDGHAFEAGTAQLLVQKEGYAAWDTTLTAVEAGGRVALQNVTLARAGTEEAATTVADDSDAEATEESAASASDSPVDRTTEPDPSSEAPNDPQPTTAEAPAPSNTESSDAGASTGILDVTPKPSGTVLVDGQQQTGGTIPLQVGRHTVTCRHPDYGSIDTTLTVAEGQTQTLSCYFTQSVTVNTVGAWGRIWLNGSNTGKNTNASEPLSLPPGTHRIEVRRESLDEFRPNGGRVKIERRGNSRYENFSGRAYQFQVEPGFARVERAVVFTVDGQ